MRRVADVIRAGASARRTILVDDEENVARAVDHGVVLDGLYLAEGFQPSDEVLDAARRDRVPIHRVSAHVLKELFGSEKRSRLFALARPPRRPRLEDLVRRKGDIVVLDGVRITGNIGAITRTACALGAAGVVLVDSGLASVLDRRVVRASRGTVFAMPMVLATREGLEGFLREHGIPLVSLAADASEPVHGIGRIGGRIALLMGSERSGASAELEGVASRRFSIPMEEVVDSLNVSVAAAIALHEHRRGTERPTAGRGPSSAP